MTHKTLKQAQADATRQAIVEALDLFEGNRTLAAESLGISRRQLHRHLVDLGLLRKTSSGGGGARQPIQSR